MPDIIYPFRQTGARSVESAFMRITRAAEQNEAAVNKALGAVEAYGSAAGRAGRGGLTRIAAGAATGGTSGGPRRATTRPGFASGEIAAAQREAAERTRIRRREETEEERSFKRRRALAERFYNERFRSAVRAAQREGRMAGQIASRTGGPAFQMPSGYDLANGALGLMGRGLTTGALAAGGALIGVGGLAARDSMRLQESANRISINARGSGQGFVDPAILRREFENTAIATPGVGAADIAEAIQGFVTKTGELEVGRKLRGTFATTASATGADIRDVSSAGADLFQKFGIRSEKEMQEALAALTFQGKGGAFELADIGSKFAKIGSAGARFGVDKGLQGVKTMGGLSQIAMSATGDRDTAATAVEATLRQLIAQSQTLKNTHKVNVFDPKTGETRDLSTVLAETIAKVGGGNMEKKAVGLQKIFGDEGIRGISPLIAAFGEGAKGATGKGGKPASEAERMAAGLARVRAELDKAITAPGTWADVQKDAAQAQQDSSAKLQAAWGKVVAIAGEKLAPEITKLVESLAGSPELFEALRHAIGGLVLFLQALGILKKEQKETPEEALARQKKENADTRAQLAALPEWDKMTPEQRDQATTLRARLNIGEGREAGYANFADQTTKRRTPEEFADYYLSLGQKESDPAREKLRIENARKVAQSIMTDPSGSVYGRQNNISEFGVAENEQQRLVRRRFALRGQAEKGDGGMVIPESTEGLAKLVEAADRAASALNKIESANRASTAVGG